MIGAWADLDVTARQAETPAPAPVAAEGPAAPGTGGIDQLAFLVGGTWVSASGGKVAEETCVWAAGNQSIRTTVVLRSGSEIAGEGHGRFNCSPTGQLMSHSEIESGGTDQRMYARQIPAAGEVHGSTPQWYFEVVFLTDGGVQHRQMILMQLGPDAMRVNQSMIVKGERIQVASVTYGRKP